MRAKNEKLTEHCEGDASNPKITRRLFFFLSGHKLKHNILTQMHFIRLIY